jgi:uncharacterized repeat protein (TIGR01451 family)
MFSLPHARRLLATLALTMLSTAASAALTVNVELNPDPPRPGEWVHAQVTVANNGGASVAAVTMRATVPAGMTNGLNVNYMSLAPSGCNLTGATSSCDPGDVMTFSLGTLPAGSATTVSIPFLVAVATPAGTVATLPAEVVVSAAVVASASDSVTVDDDNALSLALDEDFNGVPSGGTLTYTLNYGNRGINAATGTMLSLPLPAGATLVSATGGGSAAGGVVTWNLGTLAAGQSGRQQAVVSLPGTLVTGEVIEPAAASVTGSVLGIPETATAEAATVIGGGAIGIAVEANPDPVRSNERLRTEITVTNRTGADLFTVTLRARVPESIVTFNPNGTGFPAGVGVGVCNLTGSTTSCDAVDLVQFTIGTLPAGRAVTLTLPTVVAAATASGRLLTWETLVFAGGNLQSLASHTVPVDNDNALTLAVDETIDAIAQGDQLAYDLTYGNRGIDPVTGATLVFPVPVGATVADAGGGTVAGNLVTWDLGTILAGESGRRQVVVTAGAGLAAGTLLMVDAATLSGTASGPEGARGTAATNVRDNQALGLAIEADADPVRSNERLRTTVTVTNSSGAQLSNVLLKVRVPDNMATFSPSATNIAPTGCNLTGSTTSCDAGDVAIFNLGNLAAGANAVVLLPPVVADATPDGVLLLWEATVTATGTHSSTMRRAVPVDNGSALTLGLDDNVDAVAPDGTLTYTLTYGNRGITTVSGATLRLPLPAGTTLASATDGGTQVGNAVQWNVGDIPAGTSGRRQATIAVANAYEDGEGLYVNAAALTGSGANPEHARATSMTAVRGGQALALGIEASPDPARQGEQLRTEIAVTNTTGATLFNVVLKARVPDRVNTFSTAYSTGLASGCNLTGPTTSCDAGDIVIYTLTSLAAGQGFVYSLPPFIATGTESGRVLAWEAVVTADGGNVTSTTHHFAVDNDNALTLAIDDSPNGAPANGVLTYVMTYGNRSVSPVTGAQLHFPVPAGTTLLTSTGGALGDGVVTFNLGTIAAGQGGRRQLRVQLGPDLPAGSLVFLRGPQLAGTIGATGLETARASEVTPVEAAATLPPLQLTTQLSPDPASRGTAITGTVTIANNTGVDLSSVAVRVRIPDFVNTFAGSGATLVLSQGTATGCQLTGGSASCDATDKLTWSLGTPLLAGATATLTFSTAVSVVPVDGQLLALYADANDATGLYSSSTDALLIGTFTDGDADGIPNVYDNCLNVNNPDQRDTNFDGFGNRCDGDLNNSGQTNAADLALFRTAFGDVPPSQLTLDADFNGSGGFVNAADLSIFRTLFGFPPGPSALAP